MTNLDHWRHLTEALESPNEFIDMAWYWAVATAHERRVWYGDLNQPMFINPYIMFVGPPAVGKGTAMRAAARLLRDFPARNPDGTVKMQKDNPREPEALFYALPDTVIYEKLVHSIADHTHPFVTSDGDVYAHSSCYFQLEELASLLREKKSADVASLLLNLYDNVPHKYDTLRSGTATITNSCLSIIAATQPDHLRAAETSNRVGEGLISRFLLIACNEPRKAQFDYPPLTESQLASQQKLKQWLFECSFMFGPLEYADPSDAAYLQTWWETEREYLKQFAESKLAYYFERRKDQVKKLAAAMHLSESHDRKVTRDCFDRAIAFVKACEQGVIKLVERGGKNQSFILQERLVRFIQQKPRLNHEVFNFMASEMQLQEIMNTLLLLQTGNRIQLDGELWVPVAPMKSGDNSGSASPSSPPPNNDPVL